MPSQSYKIIIWTAQILKYTVKALIVNANRLVPLNTKQCYAYVDSGLLAILQDVYL